MKVKKIFPHLYTLHSAVHIANAHKWIHTGPAHFVPPPFNIPRSAPGDLHSRKQRCERGPADFDGTQF